LVHGYGSQENERNHVERKMLVTPLKTQKRRVEKRVKEALKRIRTSNIEEFDVSFESVRTEVNENAVDEISETLPKNISDIEITVLSSEVESPVIIATKHDFKQNSFTKAAQLGKWATDFNIHHNALSSLLSLTREWMPYEMFPKDPRTLLRTSRNIDVQEVEGGSFFHFGLETQVKKIISRGNLKSEYIENSPNFSRHLTVKIGIDGVPISRSSNLQFWPILAKLDQDKHCTIFPVSLFYGSQKPKCLNSFLGPFVKEMKDLEEKGLQVKGCHYIIKIGCIAADAPARSFLKQIKAHNAYFG